MKNTIYIFLFLLNSFSTISQDKNIFHDRSYWTQNPSIEQIEKDIKEGNQIDQLDKFDFDAVSWAIIEKTDNKTIYHLLKKEGNHVNKLTHDGRTYIFWAAYKGNIELINFLIKKGAKTDIIDSHGYSLVNFCAVTGQTNTKIYDLCIEHGAKINEEKNKNGANPLLLIMPFVEDLKTINYFTNKGLSIQSVDNEGNNAYSYACRTGNIKIMEYLQNKDVDVLSNNHNCLFFAAQGTRKNQNSVDLFKYLERIGVNLKTLNDKNENVLHYLTKRSKDTVLLSFFIQKDLDINHEDKNGKTPISNAIERNNISIIEFLLKQENGFLNYKDSKGNNLFHLAAEAQNIKSVSLLIKYKLEKINILNNDGLSPLHIACMKGKDDQLIKYLISIGADKEIKTEFGETAFDLAKENELLINSNIDIKFLKTQK